MLEWKERTRRPRQALDRLAEVAHAGVLQVQAGVAQAPVLPEVGERALHGRECVLHDRDDDVRAGPVGARPRRPAPELLLVEADHLVGDGGDDALRRGRVLVQW